jgi:Domain of unknown function (DUF6766)
MLPAVRFIKDNGLSLSLLLLFLAALFGESVTGLLTYDHQQASQGLGQLGYWRYLGTGAFLDGVFVNCQAAILQLTVLIVFSEFLSQRGASHSRDPDRSGGDNGRSRNAAPRRPARRGQRSRRNGRRPQRGRTQPGWLYRNSLSIVFVALFLALFALHVVFGAQAANEERRLLHQPAQSLAAFFASPKMWFETFQTWQAEFVAIVVFLVLSVFLRQQYSAESKPVEASDSDTGHPNE